MSDHWDRVKLYLKHREADLKVGDDDMNDLGDTVDEVIDELEARDEG